MGVARLCADVRIWSCSFSSTPNLLYKLYIRAFWTVPIFWIIVIFCCPWGPRLLLISYKNKHQKHEFQNEIKLLRFENIYIARKSECWIVWTLKENIHIYFCHSSYFMIHDEPLMTQSSVKTSWAITYFFIFCYENGK